MDCQENRTKKERCSLAELFDSISADNWLFKKPSTGNEDAKSTANDSFVPTLDSMTAWQVCVCLLKDFKSFLDS